MQVVNAGRQVLYLLVLIFASLVFQTDLYAVDVFYRCQGKFERDSVKFGYRTSTVIIDGNGGGYGEIITPEVITPDVPDKVPDERPVIDGIGGDPNRPEKPEQDITGTGDYVDTQLERVKKWREEKRDIEKDEGGPPPMNPEDVPPLEKPKWGQDILEG